MRVNRIKFKEIEEIEDWISLLKDEREFNLMAQSQAMAKINSKEYADSDLQLFATTEDELNQYIRSYEEDNNLIHGLIRSKTLELRLKFQERNKVLRKYKMRAQSIEYMSNKTESKRISIGKELLDNIVIDIVYNVDMARDRFEFAIVFKNNTTITKYIRLDSLKYVVKDLGAPTA